MRGRLKPGSTLLQDALAARFHVSRVPIRDALKVLEADGLITLLPNRTAVVTILTADDIEEMFAIRQMLECDLICRATLLADSNDRKLVQKILQRLDVASSGSQFAKLDREFHAALYQAAKRHRQQVIVEKLGQQLARFYGSTLEFASYHQECQGTHHEIAHAFIHRDAEQTVLCLERHLNLAKKKILALLPIQKE